MAGGCAASRGGSTVTAVWTCAAACPGDRIVAAEGRKAIAAAISMVRAMVMVSPSPAGHADSFDRVATTTSTSPPGCAAVTSQTCKALVDALARHGVEIGDDFIPEGP